jgi:hypothetical protein
MGRPAVHWQVPPPPYLADQHLDGVVSEGHRDPGAHQDGRALITAYRDPPPTRLVEMQEGGAVAEEAKRCIVCSHRRQNWRRALLQTLVAHQRCHEGRGGCL